MQANNATRATNGNPPARQSHSISTKKPTSSSNRLPAQAMSRHSASSRMRPHPAIHALPIVQTLRTACLQLWQHTTATLSQAKYAVNKNIYTELSLTGPCIACSLRSRVAPDEILCFVLLSIVTKAKLNSDTSDRSCYPVG